MTSLRSIGVAGVAAVAVMLATASTVPASSPPDTPDTPASPVGTTESSGSSGSTEPPPTVPPFTAGPTTSTSVVATSPGQTTTTAAPSPAAGVLVLPDEPLGPEAMAVVTALYEARELIIVAGMDPDTPLLDDELDRRYARSSPARGAIESLRRQLREDGLRVYPNDSVPWALFIESEVSFYSQPFLRATVVACNIDSAILYEPGGGPDGSDVLVNDDVRSNRLEFTMVPEDGGWQLWSAIALTEQVEAQTCDSS